MSPSKYLPGLPFRATNTNESDGLIRLETGNGAALRCRGFSFAVRDYTQREFSYPGDRLGAFAGVLNAFIAQLNSEERHNILGGIVFLETHLRSFWGWRISEASHRIREDKTKARALPSWSWVGWSGTVAFAPADDNASLTLPKVSVLDECNLVVDLESEGSSVRRSAPEPCAMSPQRGIVLHLWAPVIRCKLTPLVMARLDQKLPETHAHYSVWPEIQAVPKHLRVTYSRSQRIVLDKSLVSTTEPDTLYEFIGVGEYEDDTYNRRGVGPSYLIPISRCAGSDFVERWCPSVTTPIFFRQCSRESLNSQHIKML